MVPKSKEVGVFSPLTKMLHFAGLPANSPTSSKAAHLLAHVVAGVTTNVLHGSIGSHKATLNPDGRG